jgi:NarL family two-component system sensor histidine kinase LiaS
VQGQQDASGGHWGLATMYERALQVGGRFKISSRPAAGTEVEVRVPVAAQRRATA